MFLRSFRSVDQRLRVLSRLRSDLESGLRLRRRVWVIGCLSLGLSEDLLDTSNVSLSRSPVSLVNDQVVSHLELREFHDQSLLIDIVASLLNGSNS